MTAGTLLTFAGRAWALGFVSWFGWLAYTEIRRTLAERRRIAAEQRAAWRADVARVHALAEAFVRGHA